MSSSFALSDLSGLPLATEYTLRATDGEMITVWHVGSLDTMPTHGRVVNGYYEGCEGFDKYTDGDTLIECDASHPAARSWVDATQELQHENDDFCAGVMADEIRLGFSTREQVLARIHPALKRQLAVLLHLLDGAVHPDAAKVLAKQDAGPLKHNPFAALKGLR